MGTRVGASLERFVTFVPASSSYGGALSPSSSLAPSPFSIPRPIPSTQPKADVPCRRFERTTHLRLLTLLCSSRLARRGIARPKSADSPIIMPSFIHPRTPRIHAIASAVPRLSLVRPYFSVPLLNPPFSRTNRPMAHSHFASSRLARVIYRLVDPWPLDIVWLG